jgi:hypothetical protein
LAIHTAAYKVEVVQRAMTDFTKLAESTSSRRRMLGRRPATSALVIDERSRRQALGEKSTHQTLAQNVETKAIFGQKDS